MNTTVSYRVVHNVVGILGMYDSSFIGYGAGAFLAEGPRIYNDYNLGSVFGLTGWYAANVPATLSQSPVAFFPVILLEYGAIGLIYIVLLFGFAARSRAPLKTASLVMLFTTWAQSFPAAWPLFWLLLGMMLGPNFISSGRVPRKRRPGRIGFFPSNDGLDGPSASQMEQVATGSRL